MNKIIVILLVVFYNSASSQEIVNCLTKTKAQVKEYYKGKGKLLKEYPGRLTYLNGKDTISFGFNKKTGACNGIQLQILIPYSITIEKMLTLRKWKTVIADNLYTCDNYEMTTFIDDNINTRIFFFKLRSQI